MTYAWACELQLYCAKQGMSASLSNRSWYDQVATRAEEIAEELGRVVRQSEDAADEAAAAELPEGTVLFGQSLLGPLAVATLNATANGTTHIH